MSALGDRLLAMHRALQAAGVPHAFGGAIALAYCTQEPRGTRDIDVNVFVSPAEADAVFAAMPFRSAVTDEHRAAAASDGQVRVMWEDTPIDVFFAYHEFHAEVAAEIRWEPFEGELIPLLGCEALVVFKALSNRTKDWADIEAVLDAGAVDEAAVLRSLRELVGPDDAAVARLRGRIEGRRGIGP